MTNDPKFIPGNAIPKESEPPIGNPWADDVLGSKEIAKKLTSAVEDAAKANVNNAYVIGFHSEWGTGKTFLLKRWCKELKLERKPSCVAVYYNAWEDDFLANPLVAIVAELLETTREMKDDPKAVEKYGMPAVSVLNDFVSAYTGVNLAEIISDTKQKISRPGNTDEVNHYLNLRGKARSLKECLTSVAADVKRETEFPLVFVIDELDRCRPVFALEVLERVKHLFNVPGVMFVLGMNKVGLQKSIKKVYGYDDDQSEKYLRQFFDREVRMPFSSPEDYCDHLLSTNGVIGYFEKNKSFMKNPDLMTKFFIPMTNFWELTLREVEGLVRLLLDAINKEKQIGDVPDNWARLIICLMFLKVKNPVSYSRVITGEFNCKDLIDGMMEMFCDRKDAIPKYSYEFTPCQQIVREEIYRLADEDEWKKIIEQIEDIKDAQDLEHPPKNLDSVLTMCTIRLGIVEAEKMYDAYTKQAQPTRYLPRVSVKDITSLIELNDVE